MKTIRNTRDREKQATQFVVRNYLSFSRSHALRGNGIDEAPAS